MSRITIPEAFGLSNWRAALSHTRRALRGSPYEPPVMFGRSSLHIFKPRIGFPAWLGMKRADRKVRVYQLFNRVPQPAHEGYSVRVTYARDFRGGRLTYDGHLGTDFACPVGTSLVSPAPGRVLCVVFEFDRGATKIVIDHGGGLVTTYGHCARALVVPGQLVSRGEQIAWSGAAGLDVFVFFPWVAPHVHFNTWVNGRPVDPYALDDEVSLWRQRNDPLPFDGVEVAGDANFEPSTFDADQVEAAIDACRDPTWRAHFRSFDALWRRGGELLLQQNYRSAMFDAHPSVFACHGGRRPALDLPFDAADYTGAWLPDQ